MAMYTSWEFRGWAVINKIKFIFYKGFCSFNTENGPGSGSWKRNKCGKRERKSELNDRMQAT